MSESMSIYVPIIGETIIPEVVKPATRRGLKNPLPSGTRIRATLGETVIVGTVGKQESRHALIAVSVDGSEPYDHSEVCLWVESGWTFEVLGGVTA